MFNIICLLLKKHRNLKSWQNEVLSLSAYETKKTKQNKNKQVNDYQGNNLTLTSVMEALTSQKIFFNGRRFKDYVSFNAFLCLILIL